MRSEYYSLFTIKSAREIAEEALIAPPVTSGRQRRTIRRKYERSLKK